MMNETTLTPAQVIEAELERITDQWFCERSLERIAKMYGCKEISHATAKELSDYYVERWKELEALNGKSDHE